MTNGSLNLVPDSQSGIQAQPGALTAAMYGEITRLIERLHRRHLDVIRLELSRMNVDDINAVQALLLVNVSDSEVSIRELVDRGYYIGSNVTYNVRHLVERGYLEQTRSERDRRSVKIKLSERGLELCRQMADMEERHAKTLSDIGGGNLDPECARAMLRAMERVWSDSIQYGNF